MGAAKSEEAVWTDIWLGQEALGYKFCGVRRGAVPGDVALSSLYRRPDRE